MAPSLAPSTGMGFVADEDPAAFGVAGAEERGVLPPALSAESPPSSPQPASRGAVAAARNVQAR
jgi:hypothetical protein